MATPRKHWFRVADSILNETWDAATTHTVIRLMAWLNGRWAREGLSGEDASNVIIDGRTAVWITGERREHLALKRIFDLPRQASIGNMETGIVLLDETNRSDGERLSGLLDGDWDGARSVLVSLKKPTRIALSWPNFADFQGFDTPKLPPPPPPPPPPPQEGEKKKNQRRPAAAGRALESDPLALAFEADFLAALERVHPGYKPPTDSARENWRKQARLLIAERTEPEARDLARWLFDTAAKGEAAGFWRSVVLSVPKFREKFDQIAARRRQEEQRAVTPIGPGRSTSDLAERARAIVRARSVASGNASG